MNKKEKITLRVRKRKLFVWAGVTSGITTDPTVVITTTVTAVGL
mgnify:CR=1 FL=1